MSNATFALPLPVEQPMEQQVAYRLMEKDDVHPDIRVFVNGQSMLSSVDYTVTGGQVILYEALRSGDCVHIENFRDSSAAAITYVVGS